MDRCLLAALTAVLLVFAGSSPGRAQGAPATPRSKRPASAASADVRTAPAAPASAQPANEKAARDAFERGRVFYDSGAFDQASAAFEEAHRLSGRDQLLYNVYLAYRDANQPAKAAEALRGFLAKVPNIDNRAQLEARLAALDQGLARERAQQDAKAAQVAPAAQTPAPAIAVALTAPAGSPSVPERAPRSGRFWAGVSLAAVGGAMMLGAIGTGVVAHSRQQKLADQCLDKLCDPSLQSTADSGKTFAHATDGLLFGGLAVAAGGASLLFFFGGLERGNGAPAPVTAACSSHGCVAATTLRF